MLTCSSKMRKCSHLYRKLSPGTTCRSVVRRSSTLPFLQAEEYNNFDGYSVTGITPIPEYSALAVQLTHEQSGEELIKFGGFDMNNNFCEQLTHLTLVPLCPPVSSHGAPQKYCTKMWEHKDDPISTVLNVLVGPKLWQINVMKRRETTVIFPDITLVLEGVLEEIPVQPNPIHCWLLFNFQRQIWIMLAVTISF